MNKLLKGIAATALALAITAGSSVLAAPSAEAASGSNQRWVLVDENKPAFPAATAGDRVKVTVQRNTPTYDHPVYYVQPGESRLNHAQQNALYVSTWKIFLQECLDRGASDGEDLRSYCERYYGTAPTVAYFEVLPVSAQFPTTTYETTWQGFLDNVKVAKNDSTSLKVWADPIS
jgi:hypothetical protein